MINRFTKNGKCHEALDCFEHLQADGLSANVVTFTCILKDWGSIKEVHEEIVQRGLLLQKDKLCWALCW